MKLLLVLVIGVLNHQASASIYERLQGKVAGAHQGGLFRLRMNTLNQFEYALRRGVQVIEMDLRISKDGVPVVFHDEDLKPLTRCQGKVKDKTVRVIKNCRLTLSRMEIPTFELVLQKVNGQGVVNAEFKDFETIEPAIALLNKYQAHDWVYFQVRGSRQKYWHARHLDERVALVYEPSDRQDLQWALDLGDDYLIGFEVKKGTRTNENIDLIHVHNKLVTEDAWHFSWPWELFGAGCTRAYDHGIDIAISNRVNHCVKQTRNWRPKREREVDEENDWPDGLEVE